MHPIGARLGRLIVLPVLLILGLLPGTAPAASATVAPTSLVGANSSAQIFSGPATDAYTLAVRAYVWGSPLVSAANLRLALTNPSNPFVTRPPYSPGAALDNLGFQTQLSNPNYRVGVAPNVDTLYALAWLDMDQGPFVLVTPNFGSRYYTFQMAQADSSTDVALGQRTNGSQLPRVFIYGPEYHGHVPAGMIGVESRYRYFLLAGRILVNPNVPGDYESVYDLQSQIKLVPWAKYQTGDLTGPNPAPAQQALTQPTDDPSLSLLYQLGRVMSYIRPQSPAESRLVESLRKIGLTGNGFDPSDLSSHDKAEIIQGIADAKTLIANDAVNYGTKENGWTFDFQGPRFGDDWLRRAIVAKLLIYVTIPEEALYPQATTDANGQPLNGTNAYDIHFAAGQLPPVGAFWSITLYDGSGFLVANPLNRYEIGDRTPGLIHNPDGSLDDLIQNTAPSGPLAANWLPAPAGPFYLVMRLYDPQSPILSGAWKPPAIIQVPTS
jgi:hypothetical protein